MTQEAIDRLEAERELRYARLRFEDALDEIRTLMLMNVTDAAEEAEVLSRARLAGRAVRALYGEFVERFGGTGYDATGDLDALRNAIVDYRTTLGVAFSDVRVMLP